MRLPGSRPKGAEVEDPVGSPPQLPPALVAPLVVPPISSSAAYAPIEATQWIVFGDDWGTHPSTTQHLTLNLPPGDRVVWVESIGMRTPKLNLVDARRIVQKAGRLFRSGNARAGALYERDSAPVEVVGPKVLPWHGSAGVRRLNGLSLARSVGRALTPGLGGPTVLLTSVPLVADYLDRFPSCHAVAYLRLDDYAHYPGVDPELVEASETRMYERADVVFATARQLLPPPPFTHKGVYLPQGVNWDHFAGASLTPPGDPVLGFFGTLSSWVDVELIAAVARALPDWELRVVGKREVATPELDALPNVSIRGAVPFAELPGLIADWAAAWIPFRINRLTEAVNPLKVWEYRAAGLATLSTPIPEVAAMVPLVDVSTDAGEIAAWARRVLACDSAEARAARREAVRGDDWSSRAATLRDHVLAVRGGA